MASGKRITTRSEELFVCPGCKKGVTGDVELDIEVVSLDRSGDAAVKAKVIGLRVGHDCVPKVTRHISSGQT